MKKSGEFHSSDLESLYVRGAADDETRQPRRYDETKKKQYKGTDNQGREQEGPGEAV